MEDRTCTLPSHRFGEVRHSALRGGHGGGHWYHMQIAEKVGRHELPMMRCSDEVPCMLLYLVEAGWVFARARVSKVEDPRSKDDSTPPRQTRGLVRN
jgi:hypothetical protein